MIYCVNMIHSFNSQCGIQFQKKVLFFYTFSGSSVSFLGTDFFFLIWKSQYIFRKVATNMVITPRAPITVITCPYI